MKGPCETSLLLIRATYADLHVEFRKVSYGGRERIGIHIQRDGASQLSWIDRDMLLRDMGDMLARDLRRSIKAFVFKHPRSDDGEIDSW